MKAPGKVAYLERGLYYLCVCEIVPIAFAYHLLGRGITVDIIFGSALFAIMAWLLNTDVLMRRAIAVFIESTQPVVPASGQIVRASSAADEVA